MRKFGAKLLEVLRRGDMVLLALCVLTSVFGIVMVAASTAYDGSSRYVIIQTGALITGILLYLALTAFDIDILAGQRTLLFLFNNAFLAILLVWGVGLYLWRVLHGFPVSVEDPGWTLYEVLTV